MPGRDLCYEADGQQMVGSLHRPAGDGPAPGVLVFPEGPGLGEHPIERAERIARELGYVALACDLHGEQRVIQDTDEMLAALGRVREAPRIRALTTSALEALAAQPGVDRSRIAAIGFCFGGTMAFELALSGADIKAAVGFHSGLQVSSPQDASRIKGKVMALLGAQDPMITAEQRDVFGRMLTQARVDWQMTLYGGVTHSFTNTAVDAQGRPELLRYDARADQRSWRQMAALLEEAFAAD
jgi:dienelactone hydrolase